MSSRTVATSIATYSVLGASVVGILLLPQELAMPWVAAQSDPGTIQVTGVVRDFRAAHPDFDINSGHGHFAGTVKHTLEDGRPSLADEQGLMDGGLEEDVDLVAHWTFDEMSGSTAGDAGGALDGTLSGGPTWVAGQLGGALHFDGANDIVNVAPNAALNITGDVTISGWFKLDADHGPGDASQVILEKYEDDEHNTHIAIIGPDYLRAEPVDGALVFKVEHGPTGDYYRYKWTNRTSWTAGVWYHFAVTLNSSDSGQNKIFINGVDDTAPTDAGIFPDLDWDYTTEFSIGGKDADYYNLNNPSYFKGCIDDVMIFGRELTESEMTTASAGGYRVLSQWTDSDSRPIAPHLYMSGTSPDTNAWGDVGAAVNGNIRLSENGVIDSWNSSLGTYDATKGGNAVIATNSTLADDVFLEIASRIKGELLVGVGADTSSVVTTDGTSSIDGTVENLDSAGTMPTISVPTDFGPNTGPFDRLAAGTTTLSGDVHCDTFTADVGHLIRIDGDVRILCEDVLDLKGSAAIELLPGATLEIHTKASFLVHHNATINANGDPAAFMMYHYTNSPWQLHQDGSVFGYVIAPYANTRIMQSAQLYGRLVSDALAVSQSGQLHLDLAGDPAPAATSICGVPAADVEGTAGGAGTGGITSGATLREWYADILGTNLSVGHTIFLSDNGSGVYEYLTNAFHPIDDQLFGNEGDPHNNFFTFSFAASFEYDECTGQFFEFEGDDSTWLYVDDQLVMDLGGTLPATGQHVAMDRLGLVDGETYMMRFFHAQRQDGSSDFQMRTNMPLSSSSVSPAVSAGFD